MSLSVIFTTYNSPEWLEKVLWGFYYQTFKDFELIVADDGSGEETRECIERFTRQSGMPVVHVWQPDEGFQKTRILNKALLKCQYDYVVFTDGDYIPRSDFLAVHDKQKEHGHKTSHKDLKLTARGFQQRLLNNVTPARATWNGHNASGWRQDIFAVNGYDERTQYGGLDRELGERLVNFGVKPKQIRYSAICLHLYHDHSYVEPRMIEDNLAIRKATKQGKVTKTPYGIVKG